MAALKSYRHALAQYHLRPESKFLNADFADRGTTLRRHVLAIGTRHIGKEANRWEEQFFTGLTDEAVPHYGNSAASRTNFADELQRIATGLGKGAVIEMTGLSAAKLRKALTGDASILFDLMTNPALPRLRELARSRQEQRSARIEGIRRLIEKHGVRGTARLIRGDASNLRRELKQ
jgi:hypothetical protein